MCFLKIIHCAPVILLVLGTGCNRTDRTSLAVLNRGLEAEQAIHTPGRHMEACRSQGMKEWAASPSMNAG
jgi:hypothetical protein